MLNFNKLNLTKQSESEHHVTKESHLDMVSPLGFF